MLHKMSEKLCLQWNDFKQNATIAFGILREDNDFTDVTLACKDGKQFTAHKVILASSSPFFQNILRRNKHAHPQIYMRGMESEDLLAIMDFLYCGEANVYQENLDSFLAIAEELQLKGLMGKTHNDEVEVGANPKSRKETLYKNEIQSPKFLEPSQPQHVNQMAVTDYDKNVGIMARTSHHSEDLQDLDNKTNSMMVKTSNRSANGKLLYKCTLCGKEAPQTNLKNHIEANHLEGISVPCNLCEKSFRSRNALAFHKHSYHKDTISPLNDIFQD